MRQFKVTGMSCAACSARVEKEVSSVKGVTACSVNLLTGSMGVDGAATDEMIIGAVRKAGYDAEIAGNDGSAIVDTALPTGKKAGITGGETRPLIKRLIASAVFLLALMYISMGHIMLKWPLPDFLANPVAAAISEMLLSAAVLIINRRFFTSGFKAVLHGAPNMDTLVALGAAVSFGWSVYLTINMAGATVGDAHSLLHSLYFESAAMILTLITVGKMLEAYSKGRTTDAVKGLMELNPPTAVVLRGGVEVTVPATEVAVGDIFILKPGAGVPADGVVEDGDSAVDESAFTGESIPADKAKGDTVCAGTVNLSGYLKCRAVKVGTDTALSQIIKTVNDAAATKAPIARAADRVAGVFVPAVLILALITVVIWLILGRDTGFALARGISVLVISCPCALGLATPVAVMVGSGVAARQGILFKTATALEVVGRVKTVVLDKTGTVTTGHPAVTDVIPAGGADRAELLTVAVSLEQKSEHPLSRAIVEFAGAHNALPGEVTDFRAVAGNGLSAKYNGETAVGGNLRFVSEYTGMPDELSAAARDLSLQGKTPLFFAYKSRALGLIAVADPIKDDSAAAVAGLKNMGIDVVMLTGDNENTAAAVAEVAGIDKVIAGVTPECKGERISALKAGGKVCMVGDGINDAPALKTADVGIAIGAGTDIAIDAADVVLVKSSLSDVPLAVNLSRAVLRNIRENLFWAFFYNVICIPVAAGALTPLGITLDPMFGAAAMSLSSVCVVTNALRLNLFNRKRRSTKMADQKTNVTLKVDGMMCAHCEARVKSALETLPGVETAVPDHEKGEVEITLSAPVDAAVLRKAVEDQGYRVL